MNRALKGMKRIGLITDLPFWNSGNGQNARIQELVRFLKRNSDFTLYYLGDQPLPLPGIHIKNPEELRNVQLDRVIVEKLHLDWILAYLPRSIPAYLDAHDLFSDRSREFQANHRPSTELSSEEESERMKEFDKVIFLQTREVQKAKQWFPGERLLCCPHPVRRYFQPVLRPSVNHIGFLGGPSWPNIDGIQWFHDNVMPRLGKLESKCCAHGAITYSPFAIFTPQLNMGKAITSLHRYYKTVDIAINPTFYGSGFKIKTIEALGHGVPLVTTRNGAEGLLDEANHSFLLADTPEEFADAIIRLASSLSLRKKLSSNALKLTQQRFNPRACFYELIN